MVVMGVELVVYKRLIIVIIIVIVMIVKTKK